MYFSSNFLIIPYTKWDESKTVKYQWAPSTYGLPIYPFTTTGVITDEVNADAKQYVASGYIGDEKVYLYYYVNEWGVLVHDYVTADKTYSGLSMTLEEGEKPYLKKIHQYDVTVDKNVVPEEKREKEYKRTLNIFCVPENTMVVELGK